MGKVAGMGARLLGLARGVGEQRVELLDQRLDFERQRLGYPVGAGRAHQLDRPAHPAQRMETVPGLQSGHNQQPKAEYEEADGQD